jgi:ABC-2 type transport system permease protein
MPRALQKLHGRYSYSLILLKQLIKTDFKLRYQGSVLGYLWSLLRPLAIFVIMYVVFLRFLKFDYGVAHSTIYLFVGIIFWNYFADVTSTGLGSIVGKGDLLRKINFPKYVVVLTGSFSTLINLFFNMVVLGVFMALDGVGLSWHILWAIPLVIELFILAASLAFFLSALFVKLRDLNYIWEILLQAGFYATPVFYPLVLVPAEYAKWLMLNPMAQIIQDLRQAIVIQDGGQVVPTISTYWQSPWVRLVPIGLILVLAVISVQYFRRNAKSFAEEI